MKVLVIEDEYRLADLLLDWLEKEHYTVSIALDGEDGFYKAATENYDVIILDVMLPGMDGFELLEKLRRKNKKVQVLMLTAKSELEDKIKGLDTGADDYMAKPFEIRELLARVRAMTRRSGQQEKPDFLQFSDLELNMKTHELHVTKHGQAVKLPIKEYQLMEYFLLNPNQILSKEQIGNRIWGVDSQVEYNNAEVYVSFLRKKLEYLQSIVKIKTIRGSGYGMEEIHD